MPLNFSKLCDLLTQLEGIENQLPPPAPSIRQRLKCQQVKKWFERYRNAIDSTSSEAILSSLLPHRRPDRNYLLQEKRLSRVIASSYCLNHARLKDLQSYTIPGCGDLGTCVERVTKDNGHPAIPPVSVDEVDSSLNELASRSRFSNPTIRLSRSGGNFGNLDNPLEWLYRRSSPYEAKWLTRLVLKDIARFVPEDYQVLSEYHFLMPDLLRFQDSLPHAIALLKGVLGCYPATLDYKAHLAYKREASTRLCPKVGVKVGRPSFIKAWSIQSCLKLLGPRRWSAERKYDGEYCEIHIDMSKGSQCIQIYSKSGKDSTQDRAAVHGVIRECLRLGKPDGVIKSTCILLGELVVYSDIAEEILEFAKIRKHVSRSGSFLGTEKDSPAHPHEHLMVVFHDLLTIDDEMVIHEPYLERRNRLASILTKRPGRAMTAERKTLDFSNSDAKETLMEHFAWSITCRWEGLVLKPLDAPYFALHENDGSSGYQGFVKMKRDYIDSMGDEADFAVVGASYDARDAQACEGPKPRWTSFYLGCLENKDDVLRLDARPRFKIVDLVCCRACIPKADLETLCERGQFGAQPYNKDEPPQAFDVSMAGLLPPMQSVFSSPLVVEVLGSAFEKPPSRSFYMLRHPRIRKVHLDRSWKDTVSFAELQELAQKAREPAPEGESQELEKWVDVIRRTVPEMRKTRSRSPDQSPATSTPSRAQQSSTTTPGTATTTSPPTLPVAKDTSKPRSSVQSLVDVFVSLRPELVKANPSASTLTLQIGGTGSRLQLPPRNDVAKVLLKAPFIRRAEPLSISKTVHVPQQTSGSLKRPRENIDDTAGPSHATQQSRAPKRVRYTKTSYGEQSTPTSGKQKANTPTKSALRDITNSPDRRRDSLSTQSVATTCTESDDSPRSSKVVSPALRRQLQSLSRRAEKPTDSSPVWRRPIQPMTAPEPQRSSEAASSQHATPTPPPPSATTFPPFDRSIFYVGPCISKTPWIADDLLAQYGASRVRSLDQWVRERGFDADPADDSVVYESQSYPGLQKAVLLETRRRKASLAVVQEVLDLGLRERVMLYDWRVMGGLDAVDFVWGADGGEDAPQRHFYGVVDWDGRERCHYFANGDGVRKRIQYE
ncbi:MAG: hypothetical protein M1821_008788 [Bathelium mastoideum]|nr:MAG: hypothetical protein M1821_008788 [Bathelium mastoideum]